MSNDQANSTPSSHSALSCTDGIANGMQDAILLIGRIMLGWIFVQSGWRKLMDIPAFVATMPGRGWLKEAAFLGYIAPPVEVLGGAMIILGLGTRYAAILILVFTIIATFSTHAFWTFPPAQYVQQHSHFWKNVTIMGGLVLLFATAGGRFSLDQMLRRK